MARMRRRFADIDRTQENISPREQLEAAGSPRARRIMQGKIHGAVDQRRRKNLESGLRSLTLKDYSDWDRGNPYLKDKPFDDPTYTGVSWPGGRERYLSRHNPLNTEALYRQNKEIYPQHWIDYFGGEENIPETNHPYNLYLQNINTPKYEGYNPGGGYEMFKEGFPVEGWNEYERDKQRLGAEFGLGEFSGTEFPPRPLPYDASEFVGTPVERYQPTPGTEYDPMENIEYDALHTMNPADAGEFVNAEEAPMTSEPKDWSRSWGEIFRQILGRERPGDRLFNRGGIASLPYAR